MKDIPVQNAVEHSDMLKVKDAQPAPQSIGIVIGNEKPLCKEDLEQIFNTDPLPEKLKVVLSEAAIYAHWDSIKNDPMNDLAGIIVEASDYVSVARAGSATLANGVVTILIVDDMPVPTDPLKHLTDNMIALHNTRSQIKIAEITTPRRTHKQKGRNRHVW